MNKPYEMWAVVEDDGTFHVPSWPFTRERAEREFAAIGRGRVALLREDAGSKVEPPDCWSGIPTEVLWARIDFYEATRRCWETLRRPMFASFQMQMAKDGEVMNANKAASDAYSALLDAERKAGK